MSRPARDADRVLVALRATIDHLGNRLRGLTDEDLARRSGASEWSVAQVSSHLGSSSEIGLMGLRAAQAGEAQPGNDEHQRIWQRWDRLSPHEQADGCLRFSEELVSAYEGLDAATRQALRFPLPFLPEPADLTLMAGLRLNEFAHHTWDVDVAFDDSATLVREAAAVLVDALPGPLSFMTGFLGKAERIGGKQAVLAVRTTEPERELVLDVGEVVRLSSSITPVQAQTEGVISAPAEAFLRLLQGRLAPERTPPGVTVEGPLDLAEVRRLFLAV